MRTTCKLLALYLSSILLFQGCATYPPPPVDYLPPPPEQTNTVSADFIRQATAQIRQGRLDLAAATLERGLRIAPKDAMLWSQLAEVKLQQHQYQQARSLAEKSNSLAGSSRGIVQKNEQIIAEALIQAGAQ
ncbi:MAG: tetratricopeptide repeat protein [Proteobacteria bacterium]|nr:tetratricopeptide repeat protein [Pseudomonadota bacterium]MBU1140656.1 tetratricopeptide repeat protein [Pseudomonadota bacterium]MBU1233672.1 tetratricopeptide repeat protein [Pseudomonadota bacterium]MBU1418176.1 tetratricopeptide repeat protein [Pseudomonadota bacterium]MBU1454657.1 tetratricopeptide repeat protein [Pseudomonadota bacterium]